MTTNNVKGFFDSMGARMMRYGIAASFLAAVFAVAGCNVAGPDIDRVQTNLVDKSIFEGEWWYGKTVVDVDADEANIGFVFQGQMQWADLGVDRGESGTMARIRWVIDENYLFAYRAYELIDGGNDDGRDPDFRGQPLAAFAIEQHVDVKQQYNPVTGELHNVREENGSDRRWYERRFMRVDWSQNLVSDFYDVLWMMYGYQRESAPFFFQDDAHQDFPASWMPQFVRVQDDPSYRFASEWPADMQSAVHYMSFVNQELVSPGINCLFYNIPCQTAAVTVRHAFLRVPPNHEYAVETQTHDEFDRFGLFRTYQRTYVRGGQDESTRRRYCNEDSDCGSGGRCDMAAHICIGGLTDDHGETDFLTFYRPRHNFWRNALTDQECRADWECDGRYAEDGVAGTPGSVCDRAARRCTVPFHERDLAPVTYYLNPGFPRHLVKSAFQVMGDWNEVFMRGQRAVQNRSLPQGPASISCQSTDPTAYCYCGSPEDVSGSCQWKYDPFMTPAEQEALGVVEPYNCYVRAPSGFSDPASPTSYDDYPIPAVYQYEFVHDESRGDSECMLVLRSNTCDRLREDASQSCDAVAAANKTTFEDLGDIRYQFFNYIDHGNLFFGGVSIPLVDPTTGEFVTSNANMAGESIESIATRALQYLPVLRCASDAGCGPNDPTNAEELYFSGENLRGYFENLGHVEHPVTLAASGTDGYSTDDRSRPSLPASATEMASRIRGIMESRWPRLEQLRGAEGRAKIFSDRMRNLAGTPIESQLLASMGPNGRDLMHAALDMPSVPHGASVLDDEIANQVSPFRGNLLEAVGHEQRRWVELGKMNIDPPFELGLHRSSFWQYWAEAFRNRPLEESSIRMQQLFLRNVMYHEMGHSVGLRHNFGASFDRDHYADGYYNVAFELPLPDMFDFDTNGDGNISGSEYQAYYAELRRVRDERAARGIGNTMSSSTMDYAGDLSDVQGLGYYDVAATVWSHFNKADAYVGDPLHRSTDTMDGILRSDQHDRAFMTYYRGGEACEADTDCPYAATLPDGTPNPMVGAQPIYQRCVTNPRRTRLPQPCGSASDPSDNQNCICSQFTEDFLDYEDGAAYVNDADGDGEVDFYPTSYLFCTDDRTTDISWCNRFDAGESFQDAIDHYRRGFEEAYPQSYFRRFRAGGARGLASYGSIIDAAKIYQHLFFRVYYESGFSSDTGVLGVNDQYFASIDAMHWFTEIATLPDVGSYALDAATNTYRHLGEDMGMTGADLVLPPGMGYYTWSRYQDGFYGFFRQERAGVFFDKFIAMQALALRDWGLSYTLDERFYINFYDLFPVEMTEFFGGYITDNPHWFAPRIVDGNVSYPSYFRSDCSGPGVAYTPCRAEPNEVAFPGPVVDTASNDVLRNWATILALAQFPVFYDTSFEQKLMVYKLGNGDGFTIPDTQADGERTCAYGSIALSPVHVTGCADPDYVIYQSDRFHTQYIATKVRPRELTNLDVEMLGYELLTRMVDQQAQIRSMPAGPARDALRTELERNESFLEYLIQIQRSYGISSWL